MFLSNCIVLIDIYITISMYFKILFNKHFFSSFVYNAFHCSHLAANGQINKMKTKT